MAGMDWSAYIGQAPIHDADTITVNYDGNGVGVAFYQPQPYWCADSVNVLYPKFALTPAIGLFIATVIGLERYRFNYGRKWHLERMKASVIRLPSKADGTPDWQCMEWYIMSLPFSSQVSGTPSESVG
jgi:type I restriction enzyme M protein